MVDARKRSGRRPPKSLSHEAKDLWRKITEGWQLDESALKLLEMACESLDRMREAQRIIKEQGLTTADRYGKSVAHPCVLIERDSKQSFLRFMRALELDVEPAREVLGRPGGSPGWRGLH
jgi:P27 family predicted phage terminase small subunit